MKRFMTTAATALVLGTAAYADNHSATFNELTFDPAANLNASELIGMRVYATETEIDPDAQVAADGEKEWDDIGEINEIVLTRDGDVQSIIVGVGGFLGIGEKDVAVNMSEIKFVAEEGDENDFFLVVNSAKADVEAAPAYERDMEEMEAEAEAETAEQEVEQAAAETEENVEQAASEAAEEVEQAGAEVAEEAEQAADAVAEEGNEAEAELTDAAERPMLTAPTVERDGYQTAMTEDLTAEDLTGARVYGPGDEDVGEIGELILSDSGQVEKAVIDVGGFLGIGEHHVAVGLDELQIMRSDDGGDVRVYIDSTQEALEQQPEYEG